MRKSVLIMRSIRLLEPVHMVLLNQKLSLKKYFIPIFLKFFIDDVLEYFNKQKKQHKYKKMS